MTDCMMFPNDWAKFLEEYSFKDDLEVYTNGAELIPTFRVEQMMEHYLRKAVADKWISVKDRLPEPTNFVVVLTTGGDRIIARLDKYGWLRYGGYETERLRPITHWMPLPEPPKEEDK